MAKHFDAIEVDSWDLPLLTLPTRDAVRDYLIGKGTDAISAAWAAARVDVPLKVTRRGAIVWVLLFSGGELAFGECKLTPRGLTQEEVERFEQLADRLQVDWTFYAVPAWASECTGLWQSLPRELPDRPRWALTNEQLLAPSADVFWAAGANPLEWSVADDDARKAHQRTFVERLPEGMRSLQEPARLDRIMFEE